MENVEGVVVEPDHNRIRIFPQPGYEESEGKGLDLLIRKGVERTNCESFLFMSSRDVNDEEGDVGCDVLNCEDTEYSFQDHY